MNERIRHITGQVLDELVPETWTRLGYDKIKEIQNRTAELIVAECIEQVITGPNGPAHYAVEAALRLKKHFGVEE